MSTSSTSIEYYKQQYCTLFIGLLTADVTVSQGHLGVKLVKLFCPGMSVYLVRNRLIGQSTGTPTPTYL